MLQVKAITTPGKELDIIRSLFADYQKELDEDLCFQSFDAELGDPLKKYGPPAGALFLCRWNGEIAGCIALQDIGDRQCEMKRLYVKPGSRKHGIGEALCLVLIEKARELGYDSMKLDTLQKLGPAIQLYRKLGFLETTPYYSNPIAGVVYMEKTL